MAAAVACGLVGIGGLVGSLSATSFWQLNLHAAAKHCLIYFECYKPNKHSLWFAGRHAQELADLQEEASLHGVSDLPAALEAVDAERQKEAGQPADAPEVCCMAARLADVCAPLLSSS